MDSRVNITLILSQPGLITGLATKGQNVLFFSMYVCMYVCMYVFIMYVCMYVRMYVIMYVCMHVNKYVFGVYVFVCVFA